MENILIRLMIFMAIVSQLVACVNTPLRSINSEVRQCYSEAKRIWVSGVGIQENAPLDVVISHVDKDFSNTLTRENARAYMTDYANGKYANPEALASQWFYDCSQTKSDENKYRFNIIKSCFGTHRLSFEIYANVFHKNYSMESAINKIINKYSVTSKQDIAFINARARDLKLITSKKGDANLHFETVFLLCLEQPGGYGYRYK